MENNVVFKLMFFKYLFIREEVGGDGGRHCSGGLGCPLVSQVTVPDSQVPDTYTLTAILH
jgi:hypothetical protein